LRQEEKGERVILLQFRQPIPYRLKNLPLLLGPFYKQRTGKERNQHGHKEKKSFQEIRLLFQIVDE